MDEEKEEERCVGGALEGWIASPHIIGGGAGAKFVLLLSCSLCSLTPGEEHTCGHWVGALSLACFLFDTSGLVWSG